jgi:2-amino-4-hydroxy-6-hydroxymethyldihydropteridine diphosphokinase
MKRTSHVACVLLGSNIRPEANLPLAARQLRNLVEVMRYSSVWESSAVGSQQANFLNAAVVIRTPLEPTSLKKHLLLPLEARLGRVRSTDKNAARTIDLDLITYDDLILDPSLCQYAYRAVPVSEVLPGYRSENGEALKDVAHRLLCRTPLRLRADVPLAGQPTPSRA